MDTSRAAPDRTPCAVKVARTVWSGGKAEMVYLSLSGRIRQSNPIQYEFISLLARDRENLCVCGDEDQSIYGWRGATIDNILNFETDWPDAKIIKLEENYRSTPSILNAANTIIKNNKLRKPKALWTNNKDNGHPVMVQEVDTDSNEAAWVADNIKEMLDSGEYEPSQIAVLYRTNAQSRNFEEALNRFSIPYKTVGGFAFYQRAEIKDILAYLSLLVNEMDDLSFNRIINVPRRGIGPVAVSRLGEYAEFKGWSLYKTLKHLDEVPTLSSAQKNKFRSFLELMQTLEKTAQESSLKDLVEKIYKLSGYEKMLLESKDTIKAQSNIANIGELVTAASDYDEIYENSRELALAQFLENAALTSSTDETAENGEITLMTLHSAKGLEFPVVFLTGLEENVFPSFRAKDSDSEFEEERRLCYVGITRAEEQLYISYAQMRRVFGQQRYNMPSEFIKELPEDGIEYYTMSPAGIIRPQEREKTPKAQEEKQRTKWNRIFETGNHEKDKEVDKDTFSTGDHVESEAFGEGTIVQTLDKYCRVAFPGKGIKKMNFNHITKVD